VSRLTALGEKVREVRLCRSSASAALSVFDRVVVLARPITDSSVDTCATEPGILLLSLVARDPEAADAFELRDVSNGSDEVAVKYGLAEFEDMTDSVSE
jgi:hypothetical protein